MDKIGIGIDIGGTEIKAALFNLISGKILEQRVKVLIGVILLIQTILFML